MLSYQHGFHAGNFADVLKHLTYSLIWDHLLQKDKPLFCLDTHAGRGLYDLRDSQSNKTSEYKLGSQRLWNEQTHLPAVFQSYLASIKQVNQQNPGTLHYYPGSPVLAIDRMRSQDRFIACELHPKEFSQLSTLRKQGKKVFFSEEDGMHQLIALLPPPERRGLVLIDPSYEIKKEYQLIPRTLKEAVKKFTTGTFCLWYPIVDNYHHNQLLRGLDNIQAEKTLKIELYLQPSANINHIDGMQACGLYVINPPYTLKQDLKIALDYLCTLFNSGTSRYSLE